jgi:hypothetical protein
MTQNTISAAQKIVTELALKHRDLVDRADELAAQRRELSYQAHTGNASAKKRLDQLTNQTLTLALEKENVASALVEANKRLNEAQAEVEREHQKDQARKLKTVIKAFIELGRDLDQLLTELAASAEALKATVTEIHSLGSSFPSHAQLQSLGERAFHTALMGTPFQQEHTAPGERTTFSKLIGGWSSTLQQGIDRVLGESKAEAA